MNAHHIPPHHHHQQHHAQHAGATTDLPEISTARLELFSDAVFAIAITLLVLEIDVPDPHDGSMLHGLIRLWPSYGAYVFSFLIIGVVWMNHHTMFYYIRRVDRVLLVLNLLLLMCVAFIPFSAAVLAEGLATGQGSRTAAIFYGLVLTVGGIPFNAIWWYASRGHQHLSHLITPAEASTIKRHFSQGPLLYLGASVIGLVSAVASLTCFALLIVYYMLDVLSSRPEHRPGPAPAAHQQHPGPAAPHPAEPHVSAHEALSAASTPAQLPAAAQPAAGRTCARCGQLSMSS
ncbi:MULTISPECIES: TMEM175 family protein [Streptomyces]|uniref:TMEM175 family protein n=1 Tax=Streptomyces TaxID=1883 RepID=UPI0019B5E03B|nr:MULTISPECIES: TMEM175 family protein [Streptomyces]GGR95392.1 hypothetical protein GCM10010236_57420 [Streptomyces eurythermus]